MRCSTPALCHEGECLNSIRQLTLCRHDGDAVGVKIDTPLSANRFHVDLNLAYNPLCAYSSGCSCPITPPENRISVPIWAGERLLKGKWVKTE